MNLTPYELKEKVPFHDIMSFGKINIPPIPFP